MLKLVNFRHPFVRADLRRVFFIGRDTTFQIIVKETMISTFNVAKYYSAIGYYSVYFDEDQISDASFGSDRDGFWTIRAADILDILFLCIFELLLLYTRLKGL